MAIVEVEAVVEQGIAPINLHAAGGNEEIGRTVAVDVEEGRTDIVGLGGRSPGLVGRGHEGTVLLPEEKFAGLAGGTGHKDIGKTVAVHVGGGERGALAVKAVRQEPLAGEFVEGAQRVGVLEAVRDGGFGEERVGASRGLEDRGGGLRALGERGFVDREQLVGGEILQHLHLAARPMHRKFLDDGVVTEAEMHERGLAGHDAALGVELPHLHAGGGLDPELGTDAVKVGRTAGEFDDGAVTRDRVVADDGRRLVVVGKNNVEVAVAIEVGQGAAKADAQVVEAPFLRDIGKFQVAEIVIGQCALAPRLGVFPDIGAGGERGGDVLLVHEVGVDEVADHAGGHEDVEAAVVVEIAEAGGPGPAGGVHAGEVGGLGEAVGAGVEVDGVPHVLGHELGDAFHLPEAAADLLHARHELRVVAVAHVGDEKIDEAVVVEVTGVGAHREVGDVREALIDDIGEGAVAVVEVEAVGRLEIIGDIDVRPAVVIDVEPERGVALRQTPDAGRLRDIGESAVAIVVEEIVPAALRGLGKIEDVGDEIAIELAVAIIVGEDRVDGGILDVEAVGLGALGEGAVVVIDEEQIRQVVAADINVRPAILIDVHDGGAGVAGRSRLSRGDGHAGFHRDVLELEGGNLQVERAGTVPGDGENIGATVVVEVRNRDAGLDRAQGELAETRAPHARIIVDIGHRHAGVGRSEDRERFGPGGSRGARVQRSGRVIGRASESRRAQERGGGERGFKHGNIFPDQGLPGWSEFSMTQSPILRPASVPARLSTITWMPP